jgi:hypothetical protein
MSQKHAKLCRVSRAPVRSSGFTIPQIMLIFGKIGIGGIGSCAVFCLAKKPVEVGAWF